MTRPPLWPARRHPASAGPSIDSESISVESRFFARDGRIPTAAMKVGRHLASAAAWGDSGRGDSGSGIADPPRGGFGDARPDPVPARPTCGFHGGSRARRGESKNSDAARGVTFEFRFPACVVRRRRRRISAAAPTPSAEMSAFAAVALGRSPRWARPGGSRPHFRRAVGAATGAAARLSARGRHGGGHHIGWRWWLAHSGDSRGFSRGLRHRILQSAGGSSGAGESGFPPRMPPGRRFRDSESLGFGGGR